MPLPTLTLLAALRALLPRSLLCAYQHYAHNRGASLEVYEIMHNPETVDLLISLTYSAATEGVIDEEPLPIRLELRAPPPDKVRIEVPQPTPHQMPPSD
ncbi:hypothetical protein FB451DRAFT_1408450 [Mycena latifolia]|nr:hypothetical protein FB451DRAFT_1408450 [Mycena latifolia]